MVRRGTEPVMYTKRMSPISIIVPKNRTQPKPVEFSEVDSFSTDTVAFVEKSAG